MTRMEIKLYDILHWNTDSQSFVTSDKYEYTYDENGNQTLEIRYYWNTDSQSFVAIINMNTLMTTMEIKLSDIATIGTPIVNLLFQL